MSSNDYGGLAYRNGELQHDHSNCPMQYRDPLQSSSTTPREIFAHVLLGDGGVDSILVGLVKSSYVFISREGMAVRLCDIAENFHADDGYPEGVVAMDTDYYWHTGEILRAQLGGVKMQFRFVDHSLSTDGIGICVAYACIEYPNGVVWSGFSGYAAHNQIDEPGTADSEVIKDYLNSCFDLPR